MASQPFFSINADGKTYTIQKLTLGDTRALKRQFGLDSIEDLDPADPDQLVGLIYLAACKADPARDRGDILDEVEGLSIEDISAEEPEEEKAAPAPLGEDVGTPAKPKRGKKATTPASSGTPA